MRFASSKSVVALALLLAAAAVHADEPFQTTTPQTAVPDGVLEGCNTVMTVPAGKRFVVEYASASLRLPHPQRPHSQMLRTTVGGQGVFHFLKTEPAGSGNRWLVTSALRLYADAGTDVSFCYHRSAGTGTMWMMTSLSGVLVDVP